MSNRTPTQDKAIAWWCETNGLLPQLSTHPIYYFKSKETGGVTQRHPEPLTIEYKRVRDEAKRAEGKKKADK